MSKQITAKAAFAAGTKAAHHDTTKVKHSCGCWKTYRRYITLSEVAAMEEQQCSKCVKDAPVATPEPIAEPAQPAEPVLSGVERARLYVEQKRAEREAAKQAEEQRRAEKRQAHQEAMVAAGVTWTLATPEPTQAQSAPAATTTQHFQGYGDGLPQGMMIERQGEQFICFYTTYGTTVLAGQEGKSSTSHRFVTTDDTGAFAHSLTFDSHEDALAFMHGFIACLHAFNGIGQREIEAAIAAWQAVPSYVSRDKSAEPMPAWEQEHPDFCLCDRCAAEYYAMTGER